MKYSEMILKLNKNENESKNQKESNSKKTEKNIKNKGNNLQSESNEKEDSSFRRSKRKIKLIKHDSYSSENEERSNKSFSSYDEENNMLNFNKEESPDIIMTGNLIYRYSLDQIELEGFWSLNNDITRERFSYLFIKKYDKITCPIKLSEIEQANKQQNSYKEDNMENSNISNNINHLNKIKNIQVEEPLNENFVYKDEYNISICSANLFEAITISHPVIFNCITNYLTGEYHGFFFYYDKTIEDRFYINFDYDDNQVRINGEGTNNLGNFNLIGFINFYNMKDLMLKNNDLESETIKLGEFKFTRFYNAFNPNENYRVIKSFQHRKKRGGEENSFEDE